MSKISPSHSSRLIVEGPDDKWSVINLVGRHGLDWDLPVAWLPYVHPAGGISELLEQIPISATTYERLGVLLDADQDSAARWTQVVGRFQTAGIVIPGAPVAGGLVSTGKKSATSRIGVWLMPNNSVAGMLEDFLATLIPSGDACWPYTDEVCKKAKTQGAPFAEIHISKARIHSWLAWRDEPGRPFGTAITAAYFRHDTPEAIAFFEWFKVLFA